MWPQDAPPDCAALSAPHRVSPDAHTPRLHPPLQRFAHSPAFPIKGSFQSVGWNRQTSRATRGWARVGEVGPADRGERGPGRGGSGLPAGSSSLRGPGVEHTCVLGKHGGHGVAGPTRAGRLPQRVWSGAVTRPTVMLGPRPSLAGRAPHCPARWKSASALAAGALRTPCGSSAPAQGGPFAGFHIGQPPAPGNSD